MKILKILILIAIICALGGTGFLVNKLLKLKPFLSSSQASISCSVVIWNKSGQDLDIIVRPNRGRRQHVQAAYTTRACLDVQARTQQQLPSLKYIAAVYEGKKYRFSDKNALNTFFEENNSTRYFAFMTMEESDVQWAEFKQRISTDKVKIDDNTKYLVLSNYPKLSTPWDAQAKLQALKLRGPKIRKMIRVEKVENE